jgi:hypothetical protein
MTDQEFTRHALGVLLREFGRDGLPRFLCLSRSRKGRLHPAWGFGQRAVELGTLNSEPDQNVGDSVAPA